MAIMGPSSQSFNPRAQSVQNRTPPGLNVVYSNNPRVNQQRIEIARRKKAVAEYNAAVEQYNKDLSAYNKAVKAQQEQIAQAQDFNSRVASGKITFGEFQQTQFAQELIAKYGPSAGKEIQQATYLDYILSFPNPDYRAHGGSNRKDLEYSRAQSFSDAQRILKFEERVRMKQEPGYRDQERARLALIELSKKPVLLTSDIQTLNRAYDTLNLPRPDYTGTITRRDGTKENYKQGLLVSVNGNGSRQNLGAMVAQNNRPRVPVVSSPSQIPPTFSGVVVLNVPNSNFGPQYATYRNGRLVSARPVNQR